MHAHAYRLSYIPNQLPDVLATFCLFAAVECTHQSILNSDGLISSPYLTLLRNKHNHSIQNEVLHIGTQT